MIATARTTTTILAGAAFALLALTGCSGSPAPTVVETPAAEGQATAEACTTLQTGLADVSTALADSAAGFTTDPEASATLVSDAAAEFAAVVDGITNEEVKAAAIQASDDITALSEQFEQLAADPEAADADAITAAGDDAKTSIGALQTVCS